MLRDVTLADFNDYPVAKQVKIIKAQLEARNPITLDNPLMVSALSIKHTRIEIENFVKKHPELLEVIGQYGKPRHKFAVYSDYLKREEYRKLFLWPRLTSHDMNKVDFFTLGGACTRLVHGIPRAIKFSEFHDYPGKADNYFSMEYDPATYDMNLLGYEFGLNPKPCQLGQCPDVLPDVLEENHHKGNYIILHYDLTDTFGTNKNNIYQCIDLLNVYATKGWELIINTSLVKYGHCDEAQERYFNEMWPEVLATKWDKAKLVKTDLFPFRTRTKKAQMVGFILKAA